MLAEWIIYHFNLQEHGYTWAVLAALLLFFVLPIGYLTRHLHLNGSKQVKMLFHHSSHCLPSCLRYLCRHWPRISGRSTMMPSRR